MKLLFRILTLAATLTAGGVVAVATPAAAAAVNPYTPWAVCGVTSTLVDSDPILRSDNHVEVGRVYLMRNHLTGTVCATTIKSGWVGTPTETAVAIGDHAGSYVVREDAERFHTDPARMWIPLGACVLWGGYMVDPATGEVYYHSGANPAIGYNNTCF